MNKCFHHPRLGDLLLQHTNTGNRYLAIDCDRLLTEREEKEVRPGWLPSGAEELVKRHPGARTIRVPRYRPVVFRSGTSNESPLHYDRNGECVLVSDLEALGFTVVSEVEE